MPNERNLLAISIKHTAYKWRFGMPCVLWGRRTKDEEKRCFGGYTRFPKKAELYSLDDWRNSNYGDIIKMDEPVRIMDYSLCKRWKEFDTVLVSYDDYTRYCQWSSLSLDDDYGKDGE